MNEYLSVGVTGKGIARLIVMGEMELKANLSCTDARKIIHNIIEMSVEELLAYVDVSVLQGSFKASEIPQFGRMETLYMIPKIYKQRGMAEMDYPQLGLYLKNDPTSSLGANTKYGENHGKVAAQLGVLILEGCKLYPSCLTDAILSLEIHEQEVLFAKLCFRIPIVREILKRAKDEQINGYESLGGLSNATRERRGSSIRTILKQINLLDNAEITRRLNNVQWIKSEEDEQC